MARHSLSRSRVRATASGRARPRQAQRAYALAHVDHMAPTGIFEADPGPGAQVRGAATVVFSSPNDDLASGKLNGVAMAYIPGSVLWSRTAAPTSTCIP